MHKIIYRFFQILLSDGPKTAMKKSIQFVMGEILSILRQLFNFILIIVTSIIPKKKKLWIFTSRYDFSENSKYLFLYTVLNEREIDAVWLSSNHDVIDMLQSEGFEAYHTWSPHGIWLQIRAKVLVCTHSTSQEFFWGAFYRNSSVRFLVRVGHNISGSSKWHGQTLETRSKYENLQKMVDVMLLTSTNKPVSKFEEVEATPYMSADSYILSGYPKTDVLFNELRYEWLGSSKCLLSELPKLAQSKKILFYVPTKTSREEPNPILSSPKEIRKLDQLCGKINAHLVIKLHPKNKTEPSNKHNYGNITFNDSSIDVYPLLRYCDVLITDFSSIYIDFLLLDRPVIFYPYSYNPSECEYGTIHRAPLAFNYESITPGPVADSPQELRKIIKESVEGTDEFAADRQHVLNQFYDFEGGSSSQMVINKLKEKVCPEQ